MAQPHTTAGLTQIPPSFDGDKPVVPGDFGWGFTHTVGDLQMRVVMYAAPEFDNGTVQGAIIQRQQKAESRRQREIAQREHQVEHAIDVDGTQIHYEIKGERREQRMRGKNGGNGHSNGDGLSVRRPEHGPAHVHVIVFEAGHPERRLRESRFMLMDNGDGTYDCEVFHKSSRVAADMRRKNGRNGHKHDKVPDLLEEEIHHIRPQILARAGEFLDKWRETNQGTALEKQVWVKGADGTLGVPDPEDGRMERIRIQLESGHSADIYSTHMFDRLTGKIGYRDQPRLAPARNGNGHDTERY